LGEMIGVREITFVVVNRGSHQNLNTNKTELYLAPNKGLGWTFSINKGDKKDETKFDYFRYAGTRCQFNPG
jgi:hypothetical protein